MRTARPVALAPCFGALALIAMVSLGLGGCRPSAPGVISPASRPAPPPWAGLDLSREVLATLVVPSLAASSRRAAAYLQPYLPSKAPLHAAVAPVALASRFLRVFGLAAFEPHLDSTRPLALVVAHDPRQGLRVLTSLALPVRDSAALIATLTRRFDQRQRVGAEVWEFRRQGRGLLWLRERAGWLFMAPSRRLARAAPGLFRPLLRGGSVGDLRLVLQVERLSRRFPAAFARLLARPAWWPGVLALGGWQLLPSHGEVSDWLADVRRLTLRVDFEARRLTLRGVVSSRGGALARLVATLRSDRPWGLAWLPPHTPLVLGRRVLAAPRRAAWQSFFASWKGTAVGTLRQPTLELLEALGEAETLAVVTPTAGGFALMALQQPRGSAQQLTRRAQAVLDALAKPRVLSLLTTAQRAPRLRGTLRRFPSRAAGVLELRWPAARATDASNLRRWRALFGPRPCVGYRLVTGRDTTALAWVAGSACQEALGLLRRRGTTAARPTPHTAGSVARRPASWLLWVSLARLIEQGLPVVAASRQLPPQLGALVRQLLSPQMLPRSAPLALRANVQQGELRWDVEVSAGLMELVAKGLGLLYAIGSYGGPAPSTPGRAPRAR